MYGCLQSTIGRRRFVCGQLLHQTRPLAKGTAIANGESNIDTLHAEHTVVLQP